MLKIFFWIAVLFEILSMIFALLKGKRAAFISRLFFVCGSILILGMLLSSLLGDTSMIVSFAICMILIVSASIIGSKGRVEKYRK